MDTFKFNPFDFLVANNRTIFWLNYYLILFPLLGFQKLHSLMNKLAEYKNLTVNKL